MSVPSAHHVSHVEVGRHPQQGDRWKATSVTVNHPQEDDAHLDPV